MNTLEVLTLLLVVDVIIDCRGKQYIVEMKIWHGITKKVKTSCWVI